MQKQFAIILICFTSIASCWPIIPDDKQQRIREAEEIASKDLDAFRTAWNNKDYRLLAIYTEDCLKAVEEAHNHNKVLVPGLSAVVKGLTKLTEWKAAKFIRMRLLQLLTNAADGNRDNLSYYRLDAVRMWVERRSFADVKELKDAGASATAARDALENMASTLVAALKTIKVETSKVGKEDDELIRETGRKVAKVVSENKQPLLDLGEKTIRTLEGLISDWNHRTGPSTQKPELSIE